MNDKQCYVCYEGEGNVDEKKFVENLCKCKGSMVIHDACFDQLCTHQDKCGACKSFWNHDYSGYKYVYSVDSRGEKHGLYQQFYGNGKLASEANLVHGLSEGLVRHWYKNGQLKYETNYQNGDIEGQSRSWYENGQLRDEFYKEHGKLHGPHHAYYEDGSIKEKAEYVHATGLYTSYYQNGQLKEKVFYKDGLADGIWRSWTEDGVLIEKVYENGVEKKEGLIHSLWNRVFHCNRKYRRVEHYND